MTDEVPSPPESPRNQAALGFLIGGAIALLCMFLTREGRSIFGFIAAAFRDPLNNLDGQDSIVLSTIFTLAAVALASPFLVKWLPSSRLMRVILRVFSALTALVFIYFGIIYGVDDEPVLLCLISSPLLTFIGLLLIKPAKRPELGP